MLNVWVVNFKLSLHDELLHERKKDRLFFMQASLKLLKNSHSSCSFYLSFPKTGAPAWWYTGAQMRETLSQKSILVSQRLWPSSVLDSYSQGPVQLLSVGWTPAAHYPTFLSNQVLHLILNTFISFYPPLLKTTNQILQHLISNLTSCPSCPIDFPIPNYSRI